MAEIRTRFAPSPTGFLHVGGVRTALFNWLFARRHGGKYILRIDDTDAERNVEAALAPILHGFRWLNLVWDEGPEVGGPHAPYFQSQRAVRYRQAVASLLGSGHAYLDFATAEDLETERAAAVAAGRPFQYSRRFMATTGNERARFEAEGRRGTVRLKMPREGSLKLPDLVRGEVEFQWSHEQDAVIQRPDGSFIYHLANVVDDFDFAITHVLRAEEHLPNTPRQVFMIQALGYPMPQYGHLPYVAEPGSKRKLSKRKLAAYLKHADFARIYHHGLQIAQALGLSPAIETFNPVAVDFYEQVGYLPDALVNYLLLLGWSLDDRTQFLTREQMIEHFALERVTASPASFDPAKLLAFQQHYMRQLPPADKVRGVLPFLERAGLVQSPIPDEVRTHVARVVDTLGDRLTVFGDILLQGACFFGRDVPRWDEPALARLLGAAQAGERLRGYRGWLATCPDFSAPALEQGTQAWLEARDLTLRDIVGAVRVATTGVTAGPGLFDCLALLGRETCLHRIDRALEKAAGSAG